MEIKNCRKCGGPAQIRCRQDKAGKGFYVWIQCGNCQNRTREFTDAREPTADSTGVKFAAIAWNSQKIKET